VGFYLLKRLGEGTEAIVERRVASRIAYSKRRRAYCPRSNPGGVNPAVLPKIKSNVYYLRIKSVA